MIIMIQNQSLTSKKNKFCKHNLQKCLLVHQFMMFMKILMIFRSNVLLSLDFRDSGLDDFEQKFECVQEMKEQVYYINEDEEDLLAYEETSLDNSGMNALESLQKGTYLFLIMEDKGQNIFEQNDIFELSFTEISNNSKCIYDSFDFQELMSKRSLKLMKSLVFKDLTIINKCKVLTKKVKKNKFPKYHIQKFSIIMIIRMIFQLVMIKNRLLI
jgi:hypothetical protein